MYLIPKIFQHSSQLLFLLQKGVGIFAHINKLDNSETDTESKGKGSNSSKRKKRSLSSQSIEDLPAAKRAARRSSVTSNKSIVSHSKADSTEEKSIESSNSSTKEPTPPICNQWFMPVTDNIILESE